jgi:hypothetical protein
MAIKKPVYRYQYKPTAATYFKPVLNEKEKLAKSVGTQVTNLEQRFQNVGVPTETGSKEADSRNLIEKALNLKADQNALMDILEVLNRPTQVVTNILSSIGDKDKRNVLQAAWEGLSGKKEINAREALVNLTGDKNILKIKEDPNSKWDDIGQFVIDMGLEIVADPLTWIGLGVGAAKKAAQETAEATAISLVKKAGQISADGIAPLVNVVDDASGLIQLSKKVSTDLPLIKDFSMPDDKWVKEALKEGLLNEARDILTPNTNFFQQGMGIVNYNIKKLTRNTIMKLPREQAQVVIKGIRGLKNIQEKVGGLFDAFKDVKDGLRGKLDQIFGTANYKLDLIKGGIDDLDGKIEKVVSKHVKLLPGLGLEQAKKRHREALEELYEMGLEIDPVTKTVKASKKDLPRGKVIGSQIASDIGNRKKGNRWVSRPIGKGNMPHAIKTIRDMVQDANQAMGQNFLSYSKKGNFISIQLNINLGTVPNAPNIPGMAGRVLSSVDDVPLTPDALDAFGMAEMSKYQKYIGDLKLDFSTGLIPMSEEAKKMLLDPDLADVFSAVRNVTDQADALMTGSIEGISYEKSKLFAGSRDLKEQGIRYVRRVRTKEYLAELSKKNRFEPNPMMREIVAGTGKEFEERLYRGTTREYNEVLKTFYGAKDDRFSQDLVESLIDYVKVADSRFSQTEVARIVFGLDVDYEYSIERVGSRITKKTGTTGKEYAVGKLYTGKVGDLDINNPVQASIKKQALDQGFKLDDVITIGDSPKGKYAAEARSELAAQPKWTSKEHEIDRLLAVEEANEQFIIKRAKEVKIKRRKPIMAAKVATRDPGLHLVSDLSPDLQDLAIKNGYNLNDQVLVSKSRVYKHNSEWAQDSQFLRPVDEVLSETNPIIKKELIDGTISTRLNFKKSNFVTKEMAEEFKIKNPNHRILKDGFIKLDENENVIGGEFASLFKSLPSDLQQAVKEYLIDGGMMGGNMAIHNSAYEILKNAQNAYKININPGVKFFDKFLNAWKGVTLLSPSFHIRNWIGNWTNMSLAGMNPQDILRETSEAWKQIAKREEILKKMSLGKATPSEQILLRTSNSYISGLASARRGVRDLENLAELRKYSPTLRRRLTGNLKEQYQLLIEKNFKLAERADEVQRLAMFNHLKRKGLNDTQAIQRVREVLFDYGKMTDFEKTYMKRILPFYTFMKENLQFQFRNILENSPRYRNLFKGYKHYLEEVADLDEKDIPQYMSGNMWLPLPFTFNKDDKEAMSLLKLNLPASDFAEFIENPAKKIVGGVAVPIKATWEFMTGVDTFTGSPIQQFPGQRSIMREGESLFKFLRNEKGEFDISKNPTLKKFIDDLGLRTIRRPLTAILDSIDTIMGRQDVATGLFDVLEQTGITTTVKKEDLKLTALYQQLDYLRNLKKLYEQNTGQKLPLMSAAEKAGYKFKPK